MKGDRLTMGKFREHQRSNVDRLYVCDACKSNVRLEDVILTEATGSIRIFAPGSMFVYVNKDGDIVGGSQQPSEQKGDQVLTCPYCDAQHPFGFVMADEKARTVTTIGYA